MHFLQLELLNRASVPGPVLFSILSGNLDAAFHLHPHTGQLRTALELDAEIRSAYSLHIGATAAGNRAYRAECRVDIRVLDRDDNAPAIRHVGELRLSEGGEKVERRKKKITTRMKENNDDNDYLFSSPSQ
jgi:hypothetical protein